MSYEVIERTPTVVEYNDVRRKAGLSVKDNVAAQQGLGNSLYAVCIVQCGEVVGIGE